MTTEQLYPIFTASKGICTDTRKIEAGTIFFALKGANFNGNEFAVKAIEAGCLWAVVDEKEHANHEKCIYVDDVLKSLQNLARHHRRQFDIPVLGITGSNGKTTTKELIGAVLEKKFNVLMTEGNLNNHLGVPFTLLRLTKNHDFAVIEMGANRPGDIKELAEIAEPDYGIITNIGAAHIEGFGSLQGVIETKTALYRWISKIEGLLFYNADDEVLVNELPGTKTFSYGELSGDVRGNLHNLTPFVQFSWSAADYKSDIVETQLVGKYNFYNFLAAVAIGCYFKVDKAEINEALRNYEPSNNRSQIKKTDRNILIVDCYNANATSMKAALESFHEVDHPSKIAILGDMLELGDISAEEHQYVVDFLVENNLKAILVGTEFEKTNHPFESFPTSANLIEENDFSKFSDHLVLLKGSRGIKLENLIPLL